MKFGPKYDASRKAGLVFLEEKFSKFEREYGVKPENFWLWKLSLASTTQVGKADWRFLKNVLKLFQSSNQGNTTQSRKPFGFEIKVWLDNASWIVGLGLVNIFQKFQSLKGNTTRSLKPFGFESKVWSCKYFWKFYKLFQSSIQGNTTQSRKPFGFEIKVWLDNASWKVGLGLVKSFKKYYF